jgi:hypothetical protein
VIDHVIRTWGDGSTNVMRIGTACATIASARCAAGLEPRLTPNEVRSLLLAGETVSTPLASWRLANDR